MLLNISETHKRILQSCSPKFCYTDHSARRNFNKPCCSDLSVSRKLIGKKKKGWSLWWWLVCVFEQQFSVFKQYYMYFHTLFHPHAFSQMFSNNNFQFLNTYTKRALYLPLQERLLPRSKRFVLSNLITLCLG